MVCLMCLLVMTACNTAPPLLQSSTVRNTLSPSSSIAELTVDRAANVPNLPFPDNNDPSLCGIPTPWTDEQSAYLTGYYQGVLIEPTVFLYESHLRLKIIAQAPTGSEVKILLSQHNATLNYYMVRVVNLSPPNEGWLPAPFLSFVPPTS